MPTGQHAADEYILGADQGELARLQFQHHAWTQRTAAFWERGGLAAGQRVLDLGCGPGYTSLDLARTVGPNGHVLACDLSEAFLAHLALQREALGLPWIETRAGSVESIELEPDSIDLAYGRWILCWLGDPGAVVARVARALRPGGAYLVHEYLDWGVMKLAPKNAVFEQVIDACMAAWRAFGADMNVAERLPELAAAHGLELESFQPCARLGRTDSLEWRWVTGFLSTWVVKLAADGLMEIGLRDAWLAEHARLEQEGTGYLLPPLMSEAVLRRPG